MRRVLIIGSGGAGKSTVATQLGTKLGIPVIHLDAHYWHPGWIATPPSEWRLRVAELVARDVWVMDGNYGGTMVQRLAACDTVVFLDLPRVVCLWRLVRRALRYAGRSRPDMTPGCPERLSWEFVWWVWTYPSRRRPQVLQRLAALPTTTQVVLLRSSREVDAFMSAVLPAPIAS
ncbi:MAG: DNA topology modulation protein [Gemmatimonadaceae bacterium]|nr:DNA topology modulation protein [Gemmatimonadaceae bacterium]